MELKLIFVALALIELAAASKLSNKYLPPSDAASAGGHGGFLQGPQQHGHRQSNQYLPSKPKQQYGGHNAGHGAHQPSNRYLPPQSKQQSDGFVHQPSSKYLPPQSKQYYGGPNDGNTGHRLSNQYLSPKSKQFHGGLNPGKSQHHLQQPSHGHQVATLRSENSNNPDGSYHYAFDTANGIHRQEDGHLRNPNSAHPEQVVKGSYSYTGDDGQLYKVRYTADSGGFQAHGDHIPSASTGSHSNRKPHGGQHHRTSQPSRQHYSSPSAGPSPSKQYLPPPSSSSQSGGYSYNHPGGRKWE